MFSNIKSAGRPNMLAAYVASLDSLSRANLLRAFADPTVSIDAIRRALHDEGGISVSRTTVDRFAHGLKAFNS